MTKTETIPKKEAVKPQPLKKGDVVKVGKAYYKVIDVKKKEVAYKAPSNKNVTTVSILDTVSIGGVTYKVTSIAGNAFANNTKLTKAAIGSNVKTIGKKAFYKCTKLKTVTIGKNVTTIGSNACLKKFLIPSDAGIDNSNENKSIHQPCPPCEIPWRLHLHSERVGQFLYVSE